MAKHEFPITDSSGRKYKGRTIVPDKTPNPGTNHPFRTAKGQFQAQFLSGRQHGKSDGSLSKLETALNHMQTYFGSREGMGSSWKGLKQPHIDRFVEFLKTQPSLIDRAKIPRVLQPKTIKDVLGNVRKVLIVLEKGHMLRETYRAKGLKVSHKDLERPIDFPPDYKDQRDGLQVILEKCCTKWYSVASEAGRAFGMRLAERCASRDVMWRSGDRFFATRNLKPAREVTIRQLQNRYGESFVNRLIDKNGNHKIQEKMKHLVVEEAKNDRNRPVPINNPVREAAVKRLHQFIKNSPGHGKFRNVHPDTINPENAKWNYSKYLERHGADRGSMLHTHGDRHFEAQRLFEECLNNGMSIKEASAVVVITLGHDDPSKIRYYVNISKYK